MNITINFLKKHGACREKIAWFKNQSETDAVKLIKKLIKEKKFSWAGWDIVRLLSKLDCVRLAIFAAEIALSIFENAYPDDKRPRAAIQAAKGYLNNPTKENAINANLAVTSAIYAADAANADADDAYYADKTDVAKAYAYAAAADAADAAAYAAYTTSIDSAYIVHPDIAVCAAYYAAMAASSYAANAADVAIYAADVAADGGDAADIAYVVVYKKILNYGLSLLGGK